MTIVLDMPGEFVDRKGDRWTNSGSTEHDGMALRYLMTRAKDGAVAKFTYAGVFVPSGRVRTDADRQFDIAGEWFDVSVKGFNLDGQCKMVKPDVISDEGDTFSWTETSDIKRKMADGYLRTAGYAAQPNVEDIYAMAAQNMTVSPSDVKRELADEAVKIVTGARRSAYGKPENNFERIARFWQAYFENTGRDVKITAADVSPLMRLMKEARLCETPDHKDSFVDIIGYTLTGAEINGVKSENAG